MTIITLLSTVLFIGYTIDFPAARAIYGLVAVVHAYVEIPLLLFALRLASPKTPFLRFSFGQNCDRKSRWILKTD